MGGSFRVLLVTVARVGVTPPSTKHNFTALAASLPYLNNDDGLPIIDR